jgi:hypothetical protein
MIESLAHPSLLQYYLQQPHFGSNPDAPQLMDGLRKSGTYTQWSFSQPVRRMKLCYLQVNGWNCRTSCKAKKAKLKKPKVSCFLSYVDARPTR